MLSGAYRRHKDRDAKIAPTFEEQGAAVSRPPFWVHRRLGRRRSLIASALFNSTETRRRATRLQFPRRLDVDQNVSDTGVALLDRAFDLVRDLMTIAHGNIAVNADVKIHVKAHAHFANERLLDFDHAGNRRSCPPNEFDNLALRGRVHNLIKRRSHYPDAVPGDHGAGK